MFPMYLCSYVLNFLLAENTNITLSKTETPPFRPNPHLLMHITPKKAANAKINLVIHWIYETNCSL